MPNVLVADTLAAAQELQQLLAGPFSVVVATSMKEALLLLNEDISLVICGCHFDDGRMFDLLRRMKSDSNLRAIPFLAMRALEGELDDTLYESVKIATRALDGNGFVDLFRWRRVYGDADAAHRLVSRVAVLVRSPDSTSD